MVARSHRAFLSIFTRVGRSSIAGAAALAAAAPAAAWETDPIYGRDVPLADATEAADRIVDAMIDEAIARTNERSSCAWPAERAERELARQVYLATAERTVVEQRGPVRGQGFGLYAAWLETAPVVERRPAPDTEDLFTDLPFSVAPILSTLGACSVVRLAGHDVGTDKPDHFFYNGYWYYERARRRTEEAAIAWGTRTERTYYGLATSATFSFADLHANWQGYLFFRDLLSGPVAVGDDGCLTRVADFTWSDWVDWRWDEVLNPNVYTPKVQDWLDQHLGDHEACTSVSALLPDIAAHVPEALAEQGAYYTRRAPPRTDPYALAERCREVATP
jgi:hypothetical protein